MIKVNRDDWLRIHREIGEARGIIGGLRILFGFQFAPECKAVVDEFMGKTERSPFPNKT